MPQATQERYPPGQGADQEHQAVDADPAVPLRVAVLHAGEDAVVDLVLEVVIEQPWKARHHDGIPAQSRQRENQQARPPEQASQSAHAVAMDHEGQHAQQGQQAGGALGQEGQAEAEPHQHDPLARHRRLRRGAERGADEAVHRQGLEQGQQVVRTDHVGGEEGTQGAGVDQRRQPGAVRHQHAAHGEHQQHRESERQRIGRAHGPGGAAKHLHRGSDGPVGHRRLGEVDAVIAVGGRQVVARVDHLQRAAGIAPLVGVPQRARALEGKAQDQSQQEHADPGATHVTGSASATIGRQGRGGHGRAILEGAPCVKPAHRDHEDSA